MPDPMTFAWRWPLTLIGSAVGSTVSIGFAPAKSHRDACVRLSICFSSTSCCAPAATLAIVRWVGASPESIPDITLTTSFVCGLVSWWLLAALVKVAQTRSEAFVIDGLAALLPRRREARDDRPEPEEPPSGHPPSANSQRPSP